MSTANPTPNPKTVRKLHKPPTVSTLYTPHQRPRKRLQKRHTAPPPTTTSLLQTQQQDRKNQTQTTPSTLFLLEYSPHHTPSPSSSSSPSLKPEILGLYSTIDTVTSAAFHHGAYAFSNQGLLDGSEYFTPSGRLKIRACAVHSWGPSVEVREKGVTDKGEVVRLDVPHPGALVASVGLGSGSGYGGEAESGDITSNPRTSRTPEVTAKDGENGKGKGVEVFLALHESTETVFCIGVFTTKALAWGACLKDKAWLAWSDELEDEQQDVREGNCPEVSVRVKGGARQRWYVRGGEVDAHVARIGEEIGEQMDISGGGQGQFEVQVQEGMLVDVAQFGIVRKNVRPMFGRRATDLPPGVRDV
ncbi:hypothetical protein T440DRAFT_469545 [Plenodomus tracheiphilus IPT5]|uniref:Uncharacterized protein n=1 Tax=Plenodomus tracheiphilus IPT5 TaxID=1408161 RepID=A0A6A7B0T6_9PLEO|nr:hypothetical protein T440DRAFT_469545 [Plenodomus tracheiphilus IPT5]